MRTPCSRAEEAPVALSYCGRGASHQKRGFDSQPGAAPVQQHAPSAHHGHAAAGMSVVCVSSRMLTRSVSQNNLHELWALLNFLLPDVFDNPDAFDKWFSGEDDRQAGDVLEHLHKVRGGVL